MSTKFSKWSRSWALPLLMAVSIGGLCIWIGIALMNVDNGSELTPTTHSIRERVITKEVDFYHKDDSDYLRYLGKDYLLPKDKIIFIGEEVNKLHSSSERTIKTIVFDEDEQEFLFKRETFIHSYAIESTKRSKERESAMCFFLGLGFCFFALIASGISFLVCSVMLEK